MKIETKKQGAELTSIIYNGKEMLHQGAKVLDENNKPYWGRHAPVLFPIVGQLKNGRTIIDGKEYYMVQHGFARDMEFEEVCKEEDLHSYILKYNEETIKKYLYKFQLEISYKVKNENELETKYMVKNLDNKEIQFGLGAHPAFVCDYKTGNFELEFNKDEKNMQFLKLENGLISDKKADNIIEDGNKIHLDEHIFDNDALILSNIKSNTVTLKNKKTDKKVLEFDFTGFPYLGIWSKKGAPFVCIEPWFNTADHTNSDGIFNNKKDILRLNPDERFESKFKIKFFK